MLIEVPSDAVSAFVVGLHAADHLGISRKPDTVRSRHHAGPDGRVNVNPGGRFAARDLHLALERLDIGTWQAAASAAQDLGAAPMFAFGLRCDPLGRTVADRLGRSDRVPRRRHLRGEARRSLPGLVSLIATPGVRPRVMLLAHGRSAPGIHAPPLWPCTGVGSASRVLICCEAVAQNTFGLRSALPSAAASFGAPFACDGR